MPDPLVKHLGRDLTAGVVVYLVALPLCLGIALASGAPLASGLIAGIVGGIVVGAISGSHTSVAGPAAGLAAVVAAQIADLGSFSAFLVAVVLSGVIQIGLGMARAGFIAAFCPASVIKGLLAAIGVIIILKQIPHLVGHDADAEGEMAFHQPDGENPFSELIAAASHIQPGALWIGLTSILILWAWARVQFLKKSPLPGQLVVVLYGIGINYLFRFLNSPWEIRGDHLVQVPVADTPETAAKLLAFPDWSILSNPAVYLGAFTLAMIASLETLLNIDAVDQIDPEQRVSPPNRELVAQGIGNVVAGMIGGMPMTSVIIRSSVNINAGGKTKLSAVFHGILLLGSVLFIPGFINSIPLAALAAILFITGIKLASPALFRQMWAGGQGQFLPFVTTIVMIVMTDLLIGVLIGLAVATLFILRNNFRRPLRRFMERHVHGDVLRVELANQVSFFHRPSLSKTLHDVPRGGHVLIDARNTDFIDADILDLLHDFRTVTAPAHGVQVSVVGFKDEYAQLADEIKFVDYSTRELQQALTPQKVLDMLHEGNERFRKGEPIARNLRRQPDATVPGQAPLAVVLSCSDSRTPAEHIFDVGVGDILSVRIAGNVAHDKVLGSIEYGCRVAGAKLIVVMGHTGSGAVSVAVDLSVRGETAKQAMECDHLDALVDEIKRSITEPPETLEHEADRRNFIDQVAERNVLRSIDVIRSQSTAIGELIRTGAIDIAGAMYDVNSGEVRFLPPSEKAITLSPSPKTDEPDNLEPDRKHAG